MSLLDEARAIPQPPRGNPCNVVVECAKHPDLATQIIEAVHSDVPPVNVERILAKRSINISALTIGRHRSRRCTHCTHHGIAP